MPVATLEVWLTLYVILQLNLPGAKLKKGWGTIKSWF